MESEPTRLGLRRELIRQMFRQYLKLAFRWCPFLQFSLCLRFLSLRLPQTEIIRSKTSYSRLFKSCRSRKNCNSAKRNVVKYNAKLWKTKFVSVLCTVRRASFFRYDIPCLNNYCVPIKTHISIECLGI